MYYACVSGTDRGLGLELVKRLLEEGFYVFAGRRRMVPGPLDELTTLYPKTLEIINLDISDTENVKKAAEGIRAKTDKLDVLINNAAILGSITTTIYDEIDFDEILRVYNTNAIGTLRVTNALIGLIEASEKKLVVNISSEAGSVSGCNRVGWFAYCMSKSAINMESAIVHNSIKLKGGQVLVIHPGWLRTYMRGHEDEEAEETSEEGSRKIIKIIDEHEKYKGELPAYLDNQGRPLGW